jgi:TldD protein
MTDATGTGQARDHLAQDQFDWGAARRLLAEAAHGAEDGEIFLEDSRGEDFYWDDGRLKAATYDAEQGFGLRVVQGETAGFARSGNLDESAIRRAAEAAALAKSSRTTVLDVGPARTNQRLYPDVDPLAEPAFTAKTDLLAQVDAYVRARDPRVVQVSVSLSGERRAVSILRPDGQRFDDVRPLVKMRVSVTVEQTGRREIGSAGRGGREPYERLLTGESWKSLADEALRIACVNLEAIPAPAGEMDVVLGPGWPGVLIHEAVGHGLEGDFNRKGASVFSGRIGEQVAARGVTIVDDGSFEGRRGSLSFDDEGTPTRRNVLIEDGVLVGYMQDRMNARLMGVAPTGNGRRESYAYAPMPRMTNTFLEAGPHDPREILESLDRGVYAVDFGGGQVDITSGKFVFRCTEAYLVEGGRIKAPIKGATLIGDGPRAMQNVKMVGSDLAFDEGVGICGKGGQTIPAGLGQPTLRISGLTVGGAG